MFIRLVRYLPLLALASSAFGQQFDTSGNATLSGSYFLREILIEGQNGSSQITTAQSAIGTATFDGQGNYTFSGQGMNSSSGPVTALSTTGTYSVAANGMMKMTTLVGGDKAFGGVSAIGPSAFVASATESTNVDIIVGIPVSSAAGNATVKGAYSAGYIDFLNADVNAVRQALFTMTADGAGSFGKVSVSGESASNGGTATTQTVSGVSYSLTGNGSGTINFGTADPSQLISGTKNLYVSRDGQILLGGSPNGFDLLVGLSSFSGAAANSAYSGFYYTGGLEESVSGPSAGGIQIDGFWGGINATGTGEAFIHNRSQSFAQQVFDYTLTSQYSINADGSFAPVDIPYQFLLANGGSGFVANGTGGLYSLTIGLGANKYTAPANGNPYINPLGVVNAGSFAPATNPIAPNEIAALFGTTLTTTTASATTLPLPTTLGNVQVFVNGTAAPLFYVSPTQITFLVPSGISPDNNIFYATVQVKNGSTPSNAVTLYTSTSSPGVFSLTYSGYGPAAAQTTNYATISTSNPARPGQTVFVYLGGLGQTSPPVVDGAGASTTALSSTTAPVKIDFAGNVGLTLFSGLTPGTAGLYQANTTLPNPITSGDLYVDVATDVAYTSEATLNVLGNTSAIPAARQTSGTVRPKVRRTSPVKGPGFAGR